MTYLNRKKQLVSFMKTLTVCPQVNGLSCCFKEEFSGKVLVKFPNIQQELRFRVG